MRKKTNNRHGGYGLQVLLLMLVMPLVPTVDFTISSSPVRAADIR